MAHFNADKVTTDFLKIKTTITGQKDINGIKNCPI